MCWQATPGVAGAATLAAQPVVAAVVVVGPGPRRQCPSGRPSTAPRPPHQAAVGRVERRGQPAARAGPGSPGWAHPRRAPDRTPVGAIHRTHCRRIPSPLSETPIWALANAGKPGGQRRPLTNPHSHACWPPELQPHTNAGPHDHEARRFRINGGGVGFEALPFSEACTSHAFEVHPLQFSRVQYAT
jgi:hypothetical protein